MALTDTFPTQDAGGNPITDTRLVLAGLIAQNADGTPRPGVLSAPAVLVSGKAAMAYDVAPFKAALSRIAGGIELVANDAMASVVTTAAPAANSRIDVIWVRSRFMHYADVSNLPELGVTQGAAAAVPTKPSIPAGALEIASAEILSTTTTTATAVITQSAQWTATNGGVVQLRSRAELDAWAAANGSQARTLDSDLLWVRRGGVWFVAPGQQLAYMTANSGQDVANQIIGTVASTIVLPAGQRLRVRCARVGGSAVSAGSIAYTLRILNGAADVSGTTGDKVVVARGYQNGGGFVISIPGAETTFVTTVAQKVTAGLFVHTGVWTVYAPDGQELWIESA